MTGHTKRRSGLRFGAVPGLVITLALLAFAGSAQAATATLNVSASATRAPSAALNGQSYTVGTKIYVFAVTDAGRVSKVEFSLDGTLKQTDSKAPYDYAGTSSTGTANPATVPSGSHVISAKVYSGRTVVATASGSFCGCSGNTPTYELDVSTSDTRSPSSVLNGQEYATGSSIYVFTSPNTADITSVAFSVDGALYHTESKAAYDLAGSDDAAGTALPYMVPAGQHTVSAAINFSNGTSTTVQGSFTGSGSPPPPPPPPPPGGCTPTTSQTLPGSATREILNNTYHVQANEWGSTAPFAITNAGCPSFTISSSQINNSTSGAPGAYPSIYKGCHWGYCTSSSGLPLQEPVVAQGGQVTTSADTATVTSGAWDAAYDIWWNTAGVTSNNSAGGLEMMVWLAKLGPVQPAGSKVASGLDIGGRSYDVWHGGSSPGGVVSYVMTSTVAGVSNLDLGPLAADATARGYMASTWWLIDVEFGFEPWQGGQGLTLNSANVCTPAGC